MKYFESVVSEIKYDEENKIVILEWRGYGKYDVMVEASEKSLELLHNKRAQKMIVDSRNQSTITKDYEEWLKNTWIPKAKSLGLKWCAVIQNGSILKDNIIHRVVTRVDEYQVETFNTFEDAMKYLT